MNPPPPGVCHSPSISLLLGPGVSGQPRGFLAHTSPPSTMSLYLLLHLLILGVVESQTSNITFGISKVEEELRLQLNNQTCTTNRGNGTFSNDDLTEIEEELSTRSNQTVITEDDENFQSWEDEQLPRRCREKLLVAGIHMYCGSRFHEEMLTLSPEKWCVLEDVIRLYDGMTRCLEDWSGICQCFFPNHNIQEFFLEVHSYYFQNCSKEEFELEDAPQWVVLTLTIVPVSLIPVLVYLVVQKSKEQE